jgi:hypothetical protein
MRLRNDISRILGCVTLGLALSVACSTAWSESPVSLDEHAGTLTVTGHGRPPSAAQHPAQARLMAERAAIVDAYGTASRLLSDAIPETASGLEAHAVFFRGGRVVQSDLAPDGSVTVRLEIPLSPELAAQVKRAVEKGEPRVREEEREWISHDEYVARHRVRGPRVIRSREWIERYQSGAWVPYHR